MVLHKRYRWLLFISIFLSFFVTAKDNLPIEVKQQLLLGNYQQALPVLKQLAQQENSAAQYQLALLYFKKNIMLSKAEYWLIQAASKNHKASYLLGSLYAQGTLLVKNLPKAKKYLLMAQAKGDRKAKNLLNTLVAMKNKHVLSTKQVQKNFNQAILQGDLSKVIQLFHQGASLHFKNKQNETPLLIALKNNQQDIAVWLITIAQNSIKSKNLTLNLNTQDLLGNSALHIVAMKNQFKVSNLLFRNKADLNLLNRKKQTPLIVAIMAGNKTMAQQLINEKVQVNLQDQYGKTAKYYAKKQAMLLVFPFKGKYKNQPNNEYINFIKKQQRLTLQAKDKKSPYFSWPILSIAVAQKQHALIQYLLTLNYNPWQTDQHHHSAIALAITMKNTKLALKLLLQPINKILHPESYTYLFEMAIKHDQKNIITRLFTIVDNHLIKQWPIEKTPLWYAIKYQKLDMFITIARHIKPDNRQDKQQRSYLLFAARSNLTPIVKSLITLKANVNLRDNKGRSALWYAADFSNNELVSRILYAKGIVNQVGVQGYTPLMRAVMKNCYACVDTLITFGANLKQQTPNGNSVLMFAAEGKIKILKLILTDKRDLNIKMRNHHSFTALMLAVKNNCKACVSLLLNVGANPKRKNDHGKNAFDLAKNNPAILTLLTNY